MNTMNTNDLYRISISKRLHTAFNSQKARHGLTKYDDLTVEELTELAFNKYPHCPVCGRTFNTLTKKNNENYNWEISHIDPDGYLTFSNIQLCHHECNQAQYKEIIDFKAICDEYNYRCYLDIIEYSLKSGRIVEHSTVYRRYIKLYKKLYGEIDYEN